MNNPKDIARHELQDEVELTDTRRFGTCELSRWKTTKSLPTLVLTICDNGREYYPASKDLKTFQRFLRDAQPALENPDEVKRLFQFTLPIHLSVLPHPNSKYINEETGNRRPPHYDGSALVFYCNDYHVGKVVRVTIHADYGLSCEVIGDGIEMDLL